MADPYIGREIANQFRILEKIGSGGMGSVYKAEQPDMRRFVAIKILHPRYLSRPDLVSRFRREARAMSHLSHPNTAKVFLYGQVEDGACYFVMEYLQGKNLAQTVRAEGPMAPDRAIAIMVQVCGALAEAHAQGIVHRDLKPENIFLTNMGGIPDYPKVLDFGLAKVTEREMRPGSLILTQEGMVFGTPEFMSPEQARGEKLDGRSDIYSLGVIMYELLTGKLPFDAAQPMEYIQKHIKDTPIPLSRRAPNREFPPGLWEVIAKTLEKSPANRHQTANDFAQALRDVLSRPRSSPPAPEVSPAQGYAAYGQQPAQQYGSQQYAAQPQYASQQGYQPQPQQQPYASQQGYQPQQQAAYSQPQYGPGGQQQPMTTPTHGYSPQFTSPQQTSGPGHAPSASYQGPSQPTPPVMQQEAPVQIPMYGISGGSRTSWLILGLGAVLALLGTGALLLAIYLH